MTMSVYMPMEKVRREQRLFSKRIECVKYHNDFFLSNWSPNAALKRKAHYQCKVMDNLSNQRHLQRSTWGRLPHIANINFVSVMEIPCIKSQRHRKASILSVCDVIDSLGVETFNSVYVLSWYIHFLGYGEYYGELLNTAPDFYR